MRFVDEVLSFLLDRCPSCGLSAATICARCWYVLNEVGDARSPGARGLLTVATEPFLSRVLYEWDDRQPRPANVLREVILASKEKPSREMMLLWASEIFRRAMLGGLLQAKRNWILIPPPGRSGMGEDDHAGALAKAISAVSGDSWRCEPQIFERVSERRYRKSASQKAKSQMERSKIEFRISPGAKNRIERAAGYIFIDDVIATGATAKAAWVALGKPRAFECWAIAWKVREDISLKAFNELQSDAYDKMD